MGEVAVQNTTDSAPVAQPEVSVPTKAADYAAWRKDGSIPKDTPAKPEASAASTSAPVEGETAPESEAGKAEKGTQPGKRLKQRTAELDAEIAELNAKLAKRAELRKQAAEPDEKKTADSSPAEVAGPKPPVKPKQDDFKTWDEYENARDKYFEDLSDYKAAKAIADDHARQEQEAAQRTVQQKIEEGKKRYQDFEKNVTPVLSTIVGDPEIHSSVKQVVGDSPVMIDLLYVLGGDPAQFEALLQDAKTNPIRAIKKIAVLENLVMEELDGKATKTRNDKGQFEAAESEKKSTAAPPPPKEVGGRGNPPADEVESAAQKNDFRSFRTAANRRDLTRRG